MQITNEIFAHRKKSPFVISSATRKPSKAVAVNFGETIRLTGLARLSRLSHAGVEIHFRDEVHGFRGWRMTMVVYF